MIKIFITILFFIYMQVLSQDKIRVVNLHNEEPIADVEIINNNILLGLTNSEGYFYFSNEIDEIVLKKRNFFDDKISLNKKSLMLIKLEPIEGIILDEIEIKYNPNLSVLDKIYNNFVNRNNYDFNYKFKNLYIDFYSNNCEYVKLNEYAHMNKLLDKNNRKINCKLVKFDENYYKNKKLNVSGEAFVVNCLNIDYPVPFSILNKSSFFYFDEIHFFFKNFKNIKYEFIEDLKNYEISYVYNNKINNFDYDISLIIDKETNCIINYTKEIKANKKNRQKNLNLPNTDDYYDLIVKSHKEKVYFKLNDKNMFELVSEDLLIIYDLIDKKNLSKNFYYNYTLERTVEQDISKFDLIDLKEIINSKK